MRFGGVLAAKFYFHAEILVQQSVKRIKGRQQRNLFLRPELMLDNVSSVITTPNLEALSIYNNGPRKFKNAAIGNSVLRVQLT